MKLQMRPHDTPGLLITFCGLDGCGKSTQIRLLREYLEDAGYSVTLTKQPTDFVRKSDIFRGYMDQPDHDAYDYRALSLLCASDRVQHCNRVILPRLTKGQVILSDRYFYSCLANLRARGYTGDAWIYEVARSIPKPDLAVFLDVPVDTAVSRVRARPEEKERFIDMPLQYRLRDQYIQIAHENGALLLDNTKSPEKTLETILSAIIERMSVGAEHPVAAVRMGA